MSNDTKTGFSEAILATLGPFTMLDAEKYAEEKHTTKDGKSYSTYKVVVRPRDYEPAMFEVEIFRRTLERMRVLEYTRKDKLIVATLKTKLKPDVYDEVILSIGGFTK